MPASEAPLVLPEYQAVTILEASVDFTEAFPASTPQLVELGSGPLRPTAGQVYPRGDR